MSSSNHDVVYESPSGYGENIAKKHMKLDSRQSNIEKIRIRKTKVSVFSDNAYVSYLPDAHSITLGSLNVFVDLSAAKKPEVSENRDVLDLYVPELLL